ncbi:MAG: homocysteine S-methyltransferase family protein, partial [Clostridia bacterium]|nr:homocysteine S-methyltransferase family protein [Clostridia bacterium]
MDLLNRSVPVILDGATGMNLQKAGMPAGVCPEQWVLEHPDVLRALQRAFVQAGSNAVYAPTFGANRVKLKKYGLENRLAEMNRELVALSRSAVGEGVAVGGDMTSLGLFIEPFGTTSFEEVVEIYREQAEALEAAGVDFFIVETIMQLFEARAAILAIRSVSDKPI